jgi:hypothetical protein
VTADHLAIVWHKDRHGVFNLDLKRPGVMNVGIGLTKAHQKNAGDQASGEKTQIYNTC